MNATQKLIVKMLLENTGTHFLDSGGTNGRVWQRNQGKNFKNEPTIEFEYYNGILEYFTVSTFHYLSEVLELDDFAKKVNRYLNSQRKKDIDAHWLQDCSELITDKGFTESVSEVWNTYNGENNLSQVLLFSTFKNELDEIYCLLQIHGGADVRGGYTNTQCFKLNGYLTGLVEVYGTVNGIDIDTMYNGYSLTTESGENIEIKETDILDLSMHINTETYMYE